MRNYLGKPWEPKRLKSSYVTEFRIQEFRICSIYSCEMERNVLSKDNETIPISSWKRFILTTTNFMMIMINHFGMKTDVCADFSQN